MTELSIVGAGSWGTALAIVLAPRFQRIRLWVFEADLAARMRQSRENDLYLPGFSLPSVVDVTADLPGAVEGSRMILSVLPSHHVRRVYGEMVPHLQPGVSFVSATKGIENGSLRRMTEVIAEVAGAGASAGVAVISGPSFAREVANGEPTALVAASEDHALAEEVQTRFSGPTFRLYTSDDPVGVELAGAVKNVIAIGAGVCQGLGLGSNALAALITRGLAEMTRLATAMGGKARTLSGLAGLGDLVLTCTGELSRNRGLGVELARGRKLQDVIASTRTVAEGVRTTAAALELAERHGVDMPITSKMFEMLHLDLDPREALVQLMHRSLKEE